MILTSTQDRQVPSQCIKNLARLSINQLIILVNQDQLNITLQIRFTKLAKYAMV
jgi:hypothetical protein